MQENMKINKLIILQEKLFSKLEKINKRLLRRGELYTFDKKNNLVKEYRVTEKKIKIIDMILYYENDRTMA